MVARLKLKGIDGRAPPGVNHRSLPQRLCSVKQPERVSGVVIVLVHVYGRHAQIAGNL